MKKLLLALSILMLSCVDNQMVVYDFVYVKDKRTNVCYAMWQMGSNRSTMTYVPCTEEVEKQITLDAQNSRYK